KNGLIEKTATGYRLAPKGLAYVDRVNVDKLFIRNQPKIITMLVIQNSDGDILLSKRDKQPYIDQWTLPYGKLHISDESIEAAAGREAYEKLGLKDQSLVHAGDCYIRVKSNGHILSSTLAHVFSFNRDDIKPSERLQWFRPHKLSRLELAPAVEDIMARTFFHDPYFFEEFEGAI
ncbi:MAG TPA: NUDIX domain-containing protein, partial [Candidatus Saccharimonadales bacterium]|nr:NUDIX domain-containing protein [Candidatus Saccharimonadales bacterium]